MKQSYFKIGLLALSLSAPSLGAQIWSGSARPARAERCNFASEHLQRFVVADFNNDQKPDSVSLTRLGQHGSQNVFGVRVCPSGRSVGTLTVESSEPSILVTAIDVNQDGAPDIVVEQRYTQKRIQVWLNDGHGEFHRADAGEFGVSDARAPCSVGAQSNGRHRSPRRAHLLRGKKLSIQRAEIPNPGSFPLGRYRWSLALRVHRDVGGPNLSRAPPPIAIHL